MISNNNIDAIIFGTYLPNSSKLYVVKYYLEIFVSYFSDCDIYIGINPSGAQNHLIKLINKYKNKLTIKYQLVENKCVVNSDVSSIQRGLELLKNSKKNYRLIWFGHSKTVSREKMGLAWTKTYAKRFWMRRKIISAKLMASNKGSYGLDMTISTCGVEKYQSLQYRSEPDYILKYFNFKYNSLPFFYVYTFFIIKGSIVENFLKQCNPKFFSENICSFTGSNRYFMESEFIKIVWMSGFEPMYENCINHPTWNKVTDKKINFIIQQWKQGLSWQEILDQYEYKIESRLLFKTYSYIKNLL